MPIFISYSHQDADFVDALAIQLVRHRVNVWVDRWEINVGDSLISRVEEAISGASALLVVLSRSSVDSTWVRKEVNAGLVRELEDKRVVVLPVLIDDCSVPLFLQEKRFADFRFNFDAGLQTLLESVSAITNPYTGRIDEAASFSDWSLDWGTVGGRVFHDVTLVEHAHQQPFTILGRVMVISDGDATAQYWKIANEHGEDYAHRTIIEHLTLGVSENISILLVDQHEQTQELAVTTPIGNMTVRLSARRLGTDTGRDVLYHLGQQLGQLLRHMSEVASNPNSP